MQAEAIEALERTIADMRVTLRATEVDKAQLAKEVRPPRHMLERQYSDIERTWTDLCTAARRQNGKL